MSPTTAGPLRQDRQWKQPRHPYSVRAFFSSILIICIIAAFALVASGQKRHADGGTTGVGRMFIRRQLLGHDNSGNDEDCHLVHSAHDKCAYVRANCPDEEAGLFSYLQLYYCKLPHVRPIAFTIMVLWLGLLFSTIGIAASDFFCINLSTISNVLGMSESMAGATLLAFGNGSPDVFSTFAAMSTNSGSLAVGELIGAAGFITAVVAGSMALVRPFRVARKSFVRDVGFFIVAASFSMVFLADGYLQVWECAVMVAFYVFYVIIVFVWHWYLGRWRRKRERESFARGTFLIPEEEAVEVSEDPDSYVGVRNRGRGISRGSTMEDFAALERAGSPYSPNLDEDEDDDDTRDRWMAEISRNMRVSRPAPGQRQNTGNPIRPSLVGALEFRAVLSSLHKSRNHQSTPISLRRYSDDPAFTLAQQQQNLSNTPNSDPNPHMEDVHQVLANNLGVPNFASDRTTRTRAVSANDAGRLQLRLDQNASGPKIDLLGPTPPGSANLQIPPFSTGPLGEPSSPSLLISSPDGLVSDTAGWLPDSTVVATDHLAPPPGGLPRHAVQDQQRPSHHARTTLSPLYSRSGGDRQWSQGSIRSTGSSPAVPFPPYYDDPNFFPSSSRTPSILLPPSSVGSGTLFNESTADTFQRRVRWWPYALLPPPSIVISTLFPTLYTWSDKTIGEKLLGLVAAPSVLLLAITLPVVEAGSLDDDSDVVVPDPTSVDPNRNHMQTYANIITASPSSSPGLAALNDTTNIDHQQLAQGSHAQPQAESLETGAETGSDGVELGIDSKVRTQHTPNKLPGTAATTYSGHDPLSSGPVPILEERPSARKDWNRWLVCTQIFTAPLFVVLIVWANTDAIQSIRNLLLPILYSLIGSLVVLALLLLTTDPVKPPRFRILLCFVGFVVSIAWISTIANEVVGVLKAVGVILGISDAILGLTIFAVGNSLGDLVADITVARLGYPVMALSACFGGPMLNILLGIGLSGLYMTISSGNRKHDKHPGRPVKYKPYQVEVGGTLMISAVTLLITLVGLLVMVPLNKWVMDRRIGWALITLWCISTVGNVAVEVSGWVGELAWF